MTDKVNSQDLSSVDDDDLIFEMVRRDLQKSLDYFDDSELIEEMSIRGLQKTIEDYDTCDLEDELENRGEEVTLSSFTDGQISQEADGRGLNLIDERDIEILDKVYHKRRLGKEYDALLDNLIYRILGRVI